MKNKKIRYVSLESSAFLLDLDFQSMTAEERGVYCTLIFYLYENGGYLDMEKVLRGNLCNCPNFENVFEKIKHKFLIKDGKISHKRVLRELRRARKISQVNSRAGLKSAEARRLNDNERSTAVQRAFNECSTKRSEEKRSEDKRSEEKSEAKESAHVSPSGSSDDSSQRLASPTAGTIPKDLTLKIINLHDELCFIFSKRTPADTSSIRNLVNWVGDCIRLGQFQDKIIGNVLLIARDSKKGKSRKPIAVFYARLKKELNYGSGR